MIKYPLDFIVNASTKNGIQQKWQTGVGTAGAELTGAIPPEFDGPGGGYSPEDFYALAMANCFVATFKVFAEKSSLTFDDLIVDLKLTVDRDEKGFPWMARALLKAELRNPNQKEKAELLLNKTSKSCLVLNSIKTEKTFEFIVV